MASARSGQTYHQDYIARIRYSNTLPPPPNPPKLLEIPGSGLSDGHYTSAAYASRLIREQQLNIEADAELGMPIDLVGLPGVFEGDESAIYGIDPPPPVHPNDRDLLKPLNALGKIAGLASSVSFLRRTEYVSSDHTRARGDGANKDGASKSAADIARLLKRKREDLGDDNPKKMIRDIVKGFNLAYPGDVRKGAEDETDLQSVLPTPQEQESWKNPKHPGDRELRLLDSYPITIDFEALPDFGSFIMAKFSQAPVTMSDTYDRRLDAAIFRPIEHSEEKLAKYEAMRIEHRADPNRPLPPKQTFDYEFFLPEDETTAGNAQTMFDVRQRSEHSDSLYTAEREDTGHKHFRFARLRTYEHTGKEQMPDDKFNDVVALSLTDGSQSKRKAAYVYPIGSRLNLQARRAGVNVHVGSALEGEPSCDIVELAVRELNDNEKLDMENARRGYMGHPLIETEAETETDQQEAVNPDSVVADA